ncbi:Hpt domain-containing protein [Pseudanabaena sp. ABRG5-3]|uniref:Hpt domain-containing protein n=1 Tax=Pseudanabaena sp. ABRG5-3 TaxID=685565 RepID=UPI000DC6FBDD|nr:Hpt domain-containing protein [Pseudanabaena sp. ABRG5-3]BBC25658.1 multi-sensor hybrid histidine kinase [Pseudanabaena sp. ABRG5-3]
MVGNIETNAIIDISTIVKNYPEFADLPTLNVDTFQGLRQSIDDDLMFSDLVTIYLNSAENLLDEIQMAFANQDASQFSLSAHSLKSTSASIGAVRLSQICKYLEQVGKTGNISVSSDMVYLLTNEYEQVIQAIQVSVIEFMAE